MKRNTYETNVVHANYSDDGELQSVIKAFKKKPDLTGHFLVPKWLLVLGVLMATSILITLMASIFVVVLAPRPGLINESCAQRSCLKDLNLKCINKTCQCSAGYFYTNKCILTKNYMESCHLISDCKANSNLSCLNGNCNCKNSQYWNGKTCSNRVSYGKTCSYDDQCLANLNLICNTTKGTCDCKDDR